jgi:hypothetical protein
MSAMTEKISNFGWSGLNILNKDRQSQTIVVKTPTTIDLLFGGVSLKTNKGVKQ